MSADAAPGTRPAFTFAPRVTAVCVEPPRALRVTFETGAVRRVDLAFALDKPVFLPLADAAEMARVEVVDGGRGIAWASGADLSAETLYHRGQDE